MISLDIVRIRGDGEAVIADFRNGIMDGVGWLCQSGCKEYILRLDVVVQKILTGPLLPKIFHLQTSPRAIGEIKVCVCEALKHIPQEEFGEVPAGGTSVSMARLKTVVLRDQLTCMLCISCVIARDYHARRTGCSIYSTTGLL
jgi:hypothetical protein